MLTKVRRRWGEESWGMGQFILGEKGGERHLFLSIVNGVGFCYFLKPCKLQYYLSLSTRVECTFVELNWS